MQTSGEFIEDVSSLFFILEFAPNENQRDDMLSGAESQRLRLHFSSTTMIPARDLDVFGRAVYEGDIATLKEMHANKVAGYVKSLGDEQAARAAAMKWIYEMHWGPTQVPIYNLILLSTLLNSIRRPRHLQIARWLIDEVKVPIDGRDLCGSTALHHSISTKPAFDPEYAQILYDAGGSVTDRNRYGGTPAHEIAMTWELQNKEVVAKAAAALKWYLEHGGSLDIKDTDGKTPRDTIDVTRKHAASGLKMETWKIVDDEDRRRQRLADQICTFCGRPPRGDGRLLVCSKCKAARYCSGLPCQKADWAHHKSLCKKKTA